MTLITFPTGELGVNTYIISADGTGAAVIDPGGDAGKIKAVLSENGLKLKAVLLTHGHFDHIGAAAELKRLGAEIYVSKEDAPMLDNDILNMAAPFNMHVEHPVPDKFIKDGDILNIAGLEIRVISTPGHTPGGVCFLTESKLFSGDTLFHRSVGRCDHPGGNHGLLIKSIKEKLLCLPDDTPVYPGHGHSTFIGEERLFNPFLGDENET